MSKERTFPSTSFCAEGTLTSASAVPHCGAWKPMLPITCIERQTCMRYIPVLKIQLKRQPTESCQAANGEKSDPSASQHDLIIIISARAPPQDAHVWKKKKKVPTVWRQTGQPIVTGNRLSSFPPMRATTQRRISRPKQEIHVCIHMQIVKARTSEAYLPSPNILHWFPWLRPGKGQEGHDEEKAEGGWHDREIGGNRTQKLLSQLGLRELYLSERKCDAGLRSVIFYPENLGSDLRKSW